MTLNDLIDKGYITKRKHPTEDLWIYNYTAKTQHERLWNEHTLQCRGLICDSNNKIVARPFKKFFNYEEVETIPSGQHKVYTKLDGSLGIGYRCKGKAYIATRGSFNSEQAQYANKHLLTDDISNFILNWKEYTPLFEIISPVSRIVVDYKGQEKLVLLAMIHTESGAEIDIEQLAYPGEKAAVHDITLDMIPNIPQTGNEEGFVVVFEGGERIKFKFEEYKRLHAIITNISNKAIWEMLSNDQPLASIIDQVPDEFYEWVQKTAANLTKAYAYTYAFAELVVNRAKLLPDRKSQAEFIINNDKKITSIAFNLLDGNYNKAKEQCWKLVKPAYSRPFMQETD